jgi:hypothetical protein
MQRQAGTTIAQAMRKARGRVKEYRLGTLAGLSISLMPSALVAMAVVWVLASGVALFLGVAPVTAVGAGLAVVLL